MQHFFERHELFPLWSQSVTPQTPIVHCLGSLSPCAGRLTCAARNSSAALDRTSRNGQDRASRSRCRSVSLPSRVEPGRSRPRHTRTPWLSSSRAAARSSSSLLHSRARVFIVVPPRPSSGSGPGPCALSPLARHPNPVSVSLAIARRSAVR